MTKCNICGGHVAGDGEVCLTCAWVRAGRPSFRRSAKSDDSWWVGILIGLALSCLIVRCIV